MFECDKIKKATRWNRHDKRLVLGVLLLALLLLAASFLLQKGAVVVVTVNGAETASYSLKENGEYPLEGDGGSNLLQINDGAVRIKEADCPDRLCVKQGRIDKAGQSIICLPHKLVVTIRGREEPEAETDAMAQ